MNVPDTRPHVLVIGLDPRRVPGPWDPGPVVAAIEAGMRALAESGYAAESCLIGLDGHDDIPARVTAALQEHAWDCVIVGGGLRKEEELVGTFETVVNLVHRLAPRAAMGFNSRPDDLLAVVERVTRVTGE